MLICFLFSLASALPALGAVSAEAELEPLIPVQHLMVPVGWDDPEYQELIRQADQAKTPLEKRRAEIALQRYALKYTGQVFSRSEAEFKKKADKIVNRAIMRYEFGSSAALEYCLAKHDLAKLQQEADQSWKGHGPEIERLALNRLSGYFKNFAPSEPDR